MQSTADAITISQDIYNMAVDKTESRFGSSLQKLNRQNF